MKPDIDLTAEEMLTIHKAIHFGQMSVTIEGTEYQISTYRNGCRYVDVKGIRFMEQDPNKSSVYAQMAREGVLITWGQRPGRWIYIETPVGSGESMLNADKLWKTNIRYPGGAQLAL